MSILENIKYVPIHTRIKKFKRTSKKIVSSEHELKSISDALSLKDWQCDLVRIVDIHKQSMNYIAQCIGCDRQYISQEYNRVYEKATNYLNSKKKTRTYSS